MRFEAPAPIHQGVRERFDPETEGNVAWPSDSTLLRCQASASTTARTGAG